MDVPQAKTELIVEVCDGHTRPPFSHPRQMNSATQHVAREVVRHHEALEKLTAKAKKASKEHEARENLTAKAKKASKEHEARDNLTAKAKNVRQRRPKESDPQA